MRPGSSVNRDDRQLGHGVVNGAAGSKFERGEGEVAAASHGDTIGFDTFSSGVHCDGAGRGCCEFGGALLPRGIVLSGCSSGREWFNVKPPISSPKQLHAVRILRRGRSGDQEGAGGAHSWAKYASSAALCPTDRRCNRRGRGNGQGQREPARSPWQ